MFSPPGHISQEDMQCYLRGEASPDVVRRVENSMLDEPLYSEAVEGYQDLGLSNLPAFQDFSTFKKKLPQPPEAKTVRLNPARRLLRLAAVGAVLVVAALAFFALQSPTEAELFSSFYEPYENDISLGFRGGDGEASANADLMKGLSAYETGDFAEAIAAFDRVLAVESDNDPARFFAAQACLQTDDLHQALDHFFMVDANGGPYARKAEWYAILTALKMGERDLAAQLLDEFRQKKGYQEEAAQRLHRKM